MSTAAASPRVSCTMPRGRPPRPSANPGSAREPSGRGNSDTILRGLLEAQRTHGDSPLFASLRGCLAGGAPITAGLGRQVRETLGVAGIANAWVLTEFLCATSPQCFLGYADPALGVTPT